MEITLTTDALRRNDDFVSGRPALLGKAWRESRVRFFCSLVLLASLVIYAVLTSPGFLTRYNSRFPDKELIYSAYIWSGLFHYALQGLWVLAAFIVALGGLTRERVTGVALFTLALPVRRLDLFLTRASLAWAEAIAFALGSAVLIPALSAIVGESYPFLQAFAFGAWMGATGLVIVNFGLLLSVMFEGEFTAPVVGLCTLTPMFLAYRARTLPGWNLFDVMSAKASIDPQTQLLTGPFDWFGLAACLLISSILLFVAGAVIKASDF